MLTANDVKYLAQLKQKKYREQHKQFLIEGFHLVEECLSSSFHLSTIIVLTGTELPAAIQNRITKNKVKVETLTARQFSRLSDTESSQGVISVVDKPSGKPPADYGSPVVALERINDPGNLGTIIRTAWWFGAGSVIISKGSADVYNSKVIRASQGAVFHTRIFEDANLTDMLKELKQSGYGVYLFTPTANATLQESAKSASAGKSVMVFGSESAGISNQLLDAGFDQVKIPGYSNCESLNVAISAGIALYAFRNP